MATRNYLTTAALYEIIRYDDEARTARETVAFEGAIRKHPYDQSKFLLITSPGDDDSHFYEFRIADVSRAKDIRRLVAVTGETIQIVELLVRKGSHGIEMKPFEV
ncbi:MAG: hypothetical protein ACOCV0_00990 [Alkalispirochaeta sp.]